MRIKGTQSEPHVLSHLVLIAKPLSWVQIMSPFRDDKTRSEKSDSVTKDSQLGGSRGRIQTQTYWAPRVVLSCMIVVFRQRQGKPSQPDTQHIPLHAEKPTHA